MELYYSITSPYSRKVRVLIHETGLNNRINLTLCNPFADVEKLQQVNPLRKIPALVLDDGNSLYDSPVICEYLDSLDVQISTLPIAGIARFNVLRQQAIADGIMDAAISIVMEIRRTDAERSTNWMTRWTTAINASLDVLETDIQTCPDPVDIGQIAIGCALGYLDFRLADLHWRTDRVNLTTWFDRFATRESMKLTLPVD
jgi:glutathione S-transferase